MITDQHIQFEAFKNHQKYPGNTPEQNWESAKESLKIFPDQIEPTPATCNVTGYGGCNGYGVRLSQHSPYHPGTMMIISCRETFEKYLGYQTIQPNRPFPYCNGESIAVENDHMYYMQAIAQSTYRAALFLRHIETEYLHLQDVSKFSRCDQTGNLMKVVFSPFWLQQTMRVSLFTLILRAGTVVAGDCPWDQSAVRNAFTATSSAINANVADACMAFLGGNINYTGPHNPTAGSRNWVSTFQVAANCQLLKAA